MANPVAIAAKGKGYSALIRRARAINGRYSFTAAKMDRALQLFVNTLQQYECGATFPITASALARNGPVIEKYQAQNIEFAIHGLFHVDYSQLSLTEQTNHIEQAHHIFQRAKIKLTGFRCPYLRWNDDTLVAVADNGLSYDSSQALHWPVLDKYITEDYQRVLDFYRAKSANDYPALPRVVNKIVQIPYCVPDDESLIDRFKLSEQQAMSQIWQSILMQTYQLGELFTLGLHPERINLLREPLACTLAHARNLSPKVWIARLDEITNWWHARAQTTFEVTGEGNEVFYLATQGLGDVTILIRNLNIDAPVEPGVNGFQHALVNHFRFQASQRPCIGLSPDSDLALFDFLKQQGYWVEYSSDYKAYSIYLSQAKFVAADERPLLSWLAQQEAPLVCLGRWPNAAQSALCVTGDIDALTLWDYGLRFLGV